MGRTTELRREIKRVFVPYLRDKGFVSDMRHAPQSFTFRRIAEGAVHVCDVQWEKYGRPRFVVNFGTCPGEAIVVHGEKVRPEDMFPSHASPRGRLAPGRQATTGGWFRQDRPWLQRLVSWSGNYSAEEVVSRLMALFVEVEDFWTTGRVRPHIRLLRSPRPSSNRGSVVSSPINKKQIDVHHRGMENTE